MATRRFETDYAGAWRGHCTTRQSAINAAHRHLVQDGYTSATVTDKHTGEIVARLRVSDSRMQVTTTTTTQLRKVTK